MALFQVFGCLCCLLSVQQRCSGLLAPGEELQMRDGLHYPSPGPRGVLACQRWNAPAHLTLAERKQIPLALNGEIVPYRLGHTESRELHLWFEHLMLQFQRDCHNTNFSDGRNCNWTGLWPPLSYLLHHHTPHKDLTYPSDCRSCDLCPFICNQM